MPLNHLHTEVHFFINFVIMQIMNRKCSNYLHYCLGKLVVMAGRGGNAEEGEDGNRWCGPSVICFNIFIIVLQLCQLFSYAWNLFLFFYVYVLIIICFWIMKHTECNLSFRQEIQINKCQLKFDALMILKKLLVSVLWNSKILCPVYKN